MKNTPDRVFSFLRWMLTLVMALTWFSCTKTTEVFLRRPARHYTNRAVAPRKITYISTRNVRASVMIRIAGIPVDVLFDTGSSGLRVLAGAIKRAVIDTGQEQVNYPYSGGTTLYGKVAGAYLTIGGLGSPAPVKFMRIDSIQVEGGKKYPTGDSLQVNNSLLRDFNGIVGVGMRTASTDDGVANPIPQLPGAAGFIVKFPHFNGTEGRLILNPRPEDLEGFAYIHVQQGTVLLPNGLNSWMDNQLKDTLTVAGIPYTSNVLLDSGSPASFYYLNPTSDTITVKPGVKVKFTIGQPVVADTVFTVHDRHSGLDLVETSNYRVRNVFGIQFFFDFDVFYDQQDGLIGIRKK